MKPYRPSIRRLQLEFAQRLARKRMHRNLRERTPTPQKTLADNSEPWIPHPSTIGDFLAISRMVKQSEERWRRQFKHSSTT